MIATRRTRRSFFAGVFLALAIALAGCSDATLAALAKQMPVVAAANNGMAQTVISAQAAGVMTAEEARPVLNINLQVAQAGKQVDAAIAGLNNLTAAQKTTISAQITPIAAAITGEVASLQIKDASTKTAVLASLTSIQTALAIITTALGK